MLLPNVSTNIGNVSMDYFLRGVDAAKAQGVQAQGQANVNDSATRGRLLRKRTPPLCPASQIWYNLDCLTCCRQTPQTWPRTVPRLAARDVPAVAFAFSPPPPESRCFGTFGAGAFAAARRLRERLIFSIIQDKEP